MMSSVIGAVVTDNNTKGTSAKRKKTKRSKLGELSLSSSGTASPATQLRGGIEDFEEGLLTDTKDDLLTAPPPAPLYNPNTVDQSEIRTVKPDSVSYSTAKFEQQGASFEGIGSDDHETTKKKAAIMDSEGAGSWNGGYSSAIPGGSNGSSPAVSPSRSSTGSASPGKEIKRTASKLGGLLKASLKNAGKQLSESWSTLKESYTESGSGGSGEYKKDGGTGEVM